MSARILLVDDHALFRGGVRMLLEEEDNLEIVGEASNGTEALTKVRELSPDVVLMDITMPDVDGIQATRNIMTECPDTKVIALSIHGGKRFIENMLSAGAAGYLLKDSAPEELVDAISAVLSGRSYLSAAVTGMVISQYVDLLSHDQADSNTDKLTKQEHDFLLLIGEGWLGEEIEARLELDAAAVKSVQETVLEKLGLSNVSELMEYVGAQNWSVGRDGTDEAVKKATKPRKPQTLVDPPSNREMDTPKPLAKRLRSTSAANLAEKPLVLQTKFCPPNLSSDLVNRDPLTELLDGSQEVPLTLISAPPGYGKSVLVSQWLEQYDGLVFWFSLDERDSSLRRFVAHCITNFQLQLPDQFQSTGKLLHSTEQIPVSALSACLSNDLLRLDQPCTIVIDDYHVLHNDSNVHELLEVLLEHPPPTAHIILVTRIDPPLPLIRYRAANALLEIREVDLRFSSAESARLITNVTGVAPSNEALANLDKQLEGWAAGLRLTSLVLNKTEDPDAFLNSLSGGIPATQEYLLSEVVSRLDAGLREVVLKSSLLDRFCDDLVEHVCEFGSGEDPSKAGAFKFIDLIRQENLFVISIDNKGRWYRYHHLFQWLLQKELSRVAGKNVIAECHLRASQWFVDQELPDEAIKHALLAGDEQYAAAIIERYSYELLEFDQWYVLEEWLDQLPPEFIKKCPKLLMVQAWAASYQQQLERVAQIVPLIPPLLEKEQSGEELWGEVDLFMGMLNFWNGNFDESNRLLSRAQNRISESKHHAKAEADLYLGIVIYMVGNKDDAIRMMDRQMRRYPVEQLARRFGALAFVQALSGELEDLQAVANRMLAMDTSMRSPLTDAWAQYFLGFAALHNFRLETAISCFEQIIEIPHLLDRRAAIDVFAGLALAQQLQGQPELALETIDGFSAFVDERRRAEELTILHACRTRVGLLQGLDQAQLAGHYPVPEAPGIFDLFLWLETRTMSRVRRLLFEGSEQSMAEAQTLIDEVRSVSRSACLTGQLIEIEILQTLLHCHMRHEEEALKSLGESLALASQGGWIRPYVEAGETMTDLLESYCANTDDNFVRQVLSACNASSFATRGPAQGHAPAGLADRPSPGGGICDLTNRELDILELLAQRMQNKEIASQLFISTHTVKDHLKHIYQKLAVNNRRQAVLRAVELDLIEPN